MQNPFRVQGPMFVKVCVVLEKSEETNLGLPKEGDDCRTNGTRGAQALLKAMKILMRSSELQLRQSLRERTDYTYPTP